jgi:hypothetical protein
MGSGITVSVGPFPLLSPPRSRGSSLNSIGLVRGEVNLFGDGVLISPTIPSEETRSNDFVALVALGSKLETSTSSSSNTTSMRDFFAGRMSSENPSLMGSGSGSGMSCRRQGAGIGARFLLCLEALVRAACEACGLAARFVSEVLKWRPRSMSVPTLLRAFTMISWVKDISCLRRHD